MTCKSKKCANHKDYLAWEQFEVKLAVNPFNLCDTDLMPSLPDDCSRCKRAYLDCFHTTDKDIQQILAHPIPIEKDLFVEELLKIHKRGKETVELVTGGLFE